MIMAEKKAPKAKEKEKKIEERPVKHQKPAVKAEPVSGHPKKAGKEAKKEEVYNPWKVLMYPHLAEKSMNMVELENKLVFIVNRKAKKAEIKEAIERGFGVKVLAVNMEITQKGNKKAYIKLHPDYMAADIASRLGMI